MEWNGFILFFLLKTFHLSVQQGDWNHGFPYTSHKVKPLAQPTSSFFSWKNIYITSVYCKVYFQLKYFSKISCRVQYLYIFLYILHTISWNSQMLFLNCWHVFWNLCIRQSGPIRKLSVTLLLFPQKRSHRLKNVGSLYKEYLLVCWEGTYKAPHTFARLL